MTGIELERAAAAIVPPVGAGALCLVTDQQQRHRVAFVINGRGKVAVGPGFAKPRDAARFMDLLAGDPAPRSGQTTVPQASVDLSRNPSDSSAGRTGAPDEAAGEAVDGRAAAEPDARASGPRLCAGCGLPLPPGARPNRRTHGGSCRVAASRARTDGAVTTPAPREAVDRAHTTASLGARVQPQVPRQRPAGRAIDLTPQG